LNQYRINVGGIDGNISSDLFLGLPLLLLKLNCEIWRSRSLKKKK